MATDIGVKIGVEGAAQFKSSLQNVNAELRSLQSEMKAATAEFKGNESSAEAVEKKQRILKDTMETAEKKVKLLSDQFQKQNEKLKELEDELKKAEEANGKNSEEAQKARTAFEKQETATYKLKDQLNKAEAELYDVRNAEKDVGKEAEDTDKKTSRFADNLKAALTSKAITGALGAISDGLKKIGGFMWDSVVSTAEYADEVNTLAVQYNLTTDQVQEYMFMQERVDVSTETLLSSLTKLTKQMGSAKDGTGKAAEAFKTLGVEITNSDGTLRNANDVFNDTIEALGKVENETERDTIAMELFGKGAQDLNPIIATGADELDNLRQKAHDTGSVMSGEALDAANNFKDKLDDVKDRAENLKRKLAEALMPKLEELADKAIEWFDNVDWDNVEQKVCQVFQDIATVVGSLATGIRNVIGLIESLKTARPTITSRDGSEWEWVETGGLSGGYYVQKPASPGGGGQAGGFAGRLGTPTVGTPTLNTRSASSNLARGLASLSTGASGAKVIINTQQLDNATVDYVVQQVNTKLGAYT